MMNMKRKYSKPTVRVVQCLTQKFFAASQDPNTDHTQWQMGEDPIRDGRPNPDADEARRWNIGSPWDS